MTDNEDFHVPLPETELERREQAGLRKAINEIIQERDHQSRRWTPEHDYGHTPEEWVNILTHYLGKAVHETPLYRGEYYTRKDFRRRLIQIAAISAAAIEALDRQEETVQEVTDRSR